MCVCGVLRMILWSLGPLNVVKSALNDDQRQLIQVLASFSSVDSEEVHKVGFVFDRLSSRPAQVLAMSTGASDLDERRALGLLQPNDGLLYLLVRDGLFRLVRVRVD